MYAFDFESEYPLEKKLKYFTKENTSVLISQHMIYKQLNKK